MTTYQTNDEYVQRDIRGETLLVPISGDMETLDSLFTLNPTATVMWNRFDDGASREDVINTLLEEFAVSPEEAATDVDQLIQELTSIGALIPVEK